MFLLVPYHHYTPRNKVGGGGGLLDHQCFCLCLTIIIPPQTKLGGGGLMDHQCFRLCITIIIPTQTKLGAGLLGHQCFCLCLTIIIPPQTKLWGFTGPSMFLLVPYYHYSPTNKVGAGDWTISIFACALPSLYPHKRSLEGGILDHQCFCLWLTIIITPK